MHQRAEVDTMLNLCDTVSDKFRLFVIDSHELRTPMACIIGLLDMLLMEHLSVEHEGSVRQIHRCATSLVSLLNSALDIAKVILFPVVFAMRSSCLC